MDLSDNDQAILDGGYDLILNEGNFDIPGLIARTLGRNDLLLSASPAYLAERGTPRRVEDLAGHAAIVFRLPTSGRDRPWQLRQRGKALEISPTPQVRISETEGLLEALRLGLGLCQLPDMLVQDDIARGTLLELLPSCRPEPMPIHLVVPSGRMLPARVRAALDVLGALRQRHGATDKLAR